MGLTPQDFLLQEDLADEGAAVRVYLDKHDAAEAVMGAHHIAAMDEIGIADHPVMTEAQRIGEVDAVNIGAMLETPVTLPTAVMPAVMPAMVPGGGRGGTQADGRNHRQRRCRQKFFRARHDCLLNAFERTTAVHEAHLTQAKLNRVWT